MVNGGRCVVSLVAGDKAVQVLNSLAHCLPAASLSYTNMRNRTGPAFSHPHSGLLFQSLLYIVLCFRQNFSTGAHALTQSRTRTEKQILLHATSAHVMLLIHGWNAQVQEALSAGYKEAYGKVRLGHNTNGQRG